MRFPYVVAVLMCMFALTAHADTFQLFDVDAMLTNGGTITGTINLDERTGYAIRSVANFTYALGNVTQNFVGVSEGTVAENDSTPEIDLLFASTTDFFLLNLLTPSFNSLAGYNGGPICSTLNACFIGASVVYTLTDVEIAPVVSGTLISITPEPSSFALLCTGLLSVAGMVRRRLA